MVANLPKGLNLACRIRASCSCLTITGEIVKVELQEIALNGNLLFKLNQCTTIFCAFMQLSIVTERLNAESKTLRTKFSLVPFVSGFSFLVLS
jgi:hypothetical protein